jgi:hypothetical protein
MKNKFKEGDEVEVIATKEQLIAICITTIEKFENCIVKKIIEYKEERCHPEFSGETCYVLANNFNFPESLLKLKE